MQNDIRTEAFVLRRTNYGEADRILNLITPGGKISAIAKGVRKEKSRLAGGVEMFSLIDINIHQGKSEFGVVTSAKMLKYYGSIVTSLDKMELAAMILKKISIAAESSDAPEYFGIVKQVLSALDENVDVGVVETWFWFNLAKITGDEVNLYRDASGDKLIEDQKYFWDNTEMALAANTNGNIGADEIKTMRLMLTANLAVVARIKNIDKMTGKILNIARAVNRLRG